MKKIFTVTMVLILVFLGQKMRALDSSVEQSVNYIKTHLEELNEIRAQEGFESEVLSAVDYDITIETISGNLSGKFIDFDGSKGYLTIGDDLKVYDMKYVGESPFYSFSTYTKIYDVISGYIYIDDNNERNLIPELKIQTMANTIYNGQYNAGYDGIYDKQAYLDDRYPANKREFVSMNRIKINGEPAPIYKANNLLFYTWMESGVLQYEHIVELFGSYVITDVILRGKSPNKIKPGTVYYNPVDEEPAILAKKYKEHPDLTAYSNWVPHLYKEVRDYFVDNLGETGLVDYGNIPKCVKDILASKDVHIKYSFSLLYKNQLKNLNDWISQGLPVIFRFSDNDEYLTELFIVGYEEYNYTYGWWVFENTKTVLLLEIRDGNTRPIYYDISDYDLEAETFTFSYA